MKGQLRDLRAVIEQMVPLCTRGRRQQCSRCLGMGSAERDDIYEAGNYAVWSWRAPVPTKQIAPGLVMDNTLVLRTRVRFSEVQESIPCRLNGKLHSPVWHDLGGSQGRQDIFCQVTHSCLGSLQV